MESLFKDKLNPAQLDAVETLRGPVLILAGAGSGKTRVLTYRVANIIAQGEASPQQILAVTFTNKAAREMSHRIAELLSELRIPIFNDMWISTFHSTGVRILREHIHLLGYQPFFAIYDPSDQLSVIKKVMEILNISDKTHPAKQFQHLISHAKMQALSPEDISRKSFYVMDEQAVEVYRLYENEMKRSNALDFDDLLLKTFELFRMYPDVLDIYRQKFQFVMVDEYQDTNHIQYSLTKMLSEAHRNLCVVGDEDQSIYSWRGADIGNILSFEKDFPEGKVIKLEENYRSTATIVKAASQVIKNNLQRKDKTLFTNNSSGDKITVREEASDYDEARFVARQIVEHLRSGYKPQDIAIFYRTNAQSRVLEEQLRMNNLAYKIVGGVKFYERMEVKDVLGYLKLLMNPTDDVAFRRIINTPTRGLGKTTLDKVESMATSRQLPLLQAIDLAVQEKIFNSGTTKKLYDFSELMRALKRESNLLKASEIYHLVLDKTRYAVKLKEENTPESLGRLENLEELNNAILQFEQERGSEGTLQAFLEEMALVSDADQVRADEVGVTMMTLHISKGLEYPLVFMVGMEEGLFPSGRSMEERSEGEVEEERRLCYVGMTRAEKKLFMTFARNRRVWGVDQSHNPSRFLNEIPQDFVQWEGGSQKSSFLSRYANTTPFPKSTVRRPAQPAQAMPNYEEFSDENGGGSLKKGMQVRHPTYGVGLIDEVDGEGDGQKVSVVFAGNMVKKFVTKFARLEPV